LKRGKNNSGGLQRQYVLAKGFGKPAGFRVRQKGEKRNPKPQAGLYLCGSSRNTGNMAQWDLGSGILRSLSICNVKEAVSFISRYLSLSCAGASFLTK
jgi:hypothetical protein